MGPSKESTALGSGNISDLIQKRQIHNPGKGYASLMEGLGLSENRPRIVNTKKIETVTTEFNNFDPMVINEILRLTTQKNNQLEYIEEDLNFIKKFFQPKAIAAVLLTFLIMGTSIGFLLHGAISSNYTTPESISIVAPETQPQIVELEKVATTKFLNMRNSPMPAGKLLMTIAPKQVLEVIEQKKGWYHIRYTDVLSGKVNQGWVWGEFLQKLSH